MAQDIGKIMAGIAIDPGNVGAADACLFDFDKNLAFLGYRPWNILIPYHFSCVYNTRFHKRFLLAFS